MGALIFFLSIEAIAIIALMVWRTNEWPKALWRKLRDPIVGMKAATDYEPPRDMDVASYIIAAFWIRYVLYVATAPVWFPVQFLPAFIANRLAISRTRRIAKVRARAVISENEECLLCGNRKGKLVSFAIGGVPKLKYSCQVCGAWTVGPSAWELRHGGDAPPKDTIHAIDEQLPFQRLANVPLASNEHQPQQTYGPRKGYGRSPK